MSVCVNSGNGLTEGYLQEAGREVMPAVHWGRPDVLFTPAYWRWQAELCMPNVGAGRHRLATSLRSECVACVLGGHGIPAEVGLAAYETLNRRGIIDKSFVTYDEVLQVLREPIALPNGRLVRYRFAAQKSRCLAEILNAELEPPTADRRAIRDWLTRFRGIGMKTASWIVRNWYSADDVAILDIHIYRAGVLAGVFDKRLTIARDYLVLEQRFLDFASAIDVPASLLDAVIWHQMKRAGSLVHRLLSC